jgi:hypothetical protein
MKKDDLFHKCALQAGIIALFEGRMNDSEYVRNMTFSFYEEDLKKENIKNDA